MFVAKFVPTSGEPFQADKNGNYPFLVTESNLYAGICRGGLINGSTFQRDKLSTDKIYVCENYTEMYEGKPQIRVKVIEAIKSFEIPEYRTHFGAPRFELPAKGETVHQEGGETLKDVLSDPIPAEVQKKESVEA